MLPGDPDTCEAAAGYYERYTRLCLKETALIDGRVAYDMGNVRRTFGVDLGCYWLTGWGSGVVLLVVVVVVALVLVLVLVLVLL